MKKLLALLIFLPVLAGAWTTNTVTGDDKIQVWAESAGPLKLFSLTASNYDNAARYLMLFAVDSPLNGDSPIRQWRMTNNAKLSLNFEPDGLFVRSVTAAGVLKQGCTFWVSTTTTTLTKSTTTKTDFTSVKMTQSEVPSVPVNGGVPIINTVSSSNKVIFVDSQNGNDTNGNGSLTFPFKTIGYTFSDPEGTSLFARGGAVSVANPGDTLYLMPGNYTNEVVQLWTTNLVDSRGLNLIGSGATCTFLWMRGTLVGGNSGMNLVQFGNNSEVAHLCFPTNNVGGGNQWYNPMGNASGTEFWQSYSLDAGLWDGSDNRIVNCTNVWVHDIKGWGGNDFVYLSQLADYSVRFDDVEGYGRWDTFAVYGDNTNRINKTECFNCTFFVLGGVTGGGSVVHAVDCHGGEHIFHNCTFKSFDGAANKTWGVLAEDGVGAYGASNVVELYSCNIIAQSTNGGAHSISNFTSSAGKSIVNIFGGNMDTTTMVGVNGGFLYNTNTGAFTVLGSVAGNGVNLTNTWRCETLTGTVSTNGVLINATYFAPVTGNTTVLQAGANTNIAAHALPGGGYYSNFVCGVAGKGLNSATTNITYELQFGTNSTVFIGCVSTTLTNTLVPGVTGITFTNTTTNYWPVGDLGGLVGTVRISPSVVISQPAPQSYWWKVEHWYQKN